MYINLKKYKETQVDYGKGINGFIFAMDDTQYKNFKIMVQK